MNITNINQCCGCESCYNICSRDAISMTQDNEGFFVPVIDNILCIECNKCKKVCPINVDQKYRDYDIKAYACYNKNLEVRLSSTSGGIFYLLAEHIIEKHHGIVFGACFTNEFRVVHEGIEKVEDINKLQGSKYVQSQIGDSYRQIKKYLEDDRVVLFSGLPCQVEGLRTFLGREFNNLLCIDMACFGVPSPMIWEKYLKEYFGKYEIKKIIFKDKIVSWKYWNFRIDTNKGQKYYLKMHNIYMNSFLRRLNVRESCSVCKFKGIRRNSDITIADCWGIGESNVRLNDDRGLSAVLIQSEKGQNIFQNIIDKVVYEEYDPTELMQGNWAMSNSIQLNEDRNKFFSDLSKKSFKSVMNKYCKLKLSERLKYRMKKILKQYP